MKYKPLLIVSIVVLAAAIFLFYQAQIDTCKDCQMIKTAAGIVCTAMGLSTLYIFIREQFSK